VIGILRVDKPQGLTSHDVISRVRRTLGERRVGHAGTLDPFASGLLLVCLGGATRLMEYLHQLDKVYEAEALLGVTTDTDDLEGCVTAQRDTWRSLEASAIAAALQGRTGSVLQQPPVYSSKKVQGVPAHRRVRMGEAVDLAPARVEIHSVELLAVDLPRIRFRIRCGTGTYIRAFARDVGEDLGCGAHLVALRRTAIGSHRVDDAVLPGQLDSACVLPPEVALQHLADVVLEPDVASRLQHGQRVTLPCPEHVVPGEPVALFDSGRLLGVGRWQDGVLHPLKILAGEPS